MTKRPPRGLDTPRFALLDRLARRLQDGAVDDTTTHAAVSLLTASADPDRADRLVVGPRDSAVLVERLAVWSLHRASDDAVGAAGRLLDATPPEAEARTTDAGLALMR